MNSKGMHKSSLCAEQVQLSVQIHRQSLRLPPQQQRLQHVTLIQLGKLTAAFYIAVRTGTDCTSMRTAYVTKCFKVVSGNMHYVYLYLVKCIDRAMMQVVGAFEKDGQKLPQTLTGKWDTALEALMADGSKQTIWKVHPLPKVTSRCWPFSLPTPPPPQLLFVSPPAVFMPAAVVNPTGELIFCSSSQVWCLIMLYSPLHAASDCCIRMGF